MNSFNFPKKLCIFALLSLLTINIAVAKEKPANLSIKQLEKKLNSLPKKTQKTAGKTSTRTTKTSRAAATPKTSIVKEINGEALSDFYSNATFLLNHSNNKIIYQKNSDVASPIASVTKLMTAMVVLDANLDLDEIISISDDDIDRLRFSSSRLPVGFRVRRGDALLLLLMSSENRAANALARYYPTGKEGFINDMNKKAKSLGMYSSNFEDSSGLSEGNISTAHDLALMVTAANNYPLIRQYSTTPHAEVRYQGRIINFSNTNPRVRENGTNDDMRIILSKTGYIRAAGYCLVMTALINSQPITVVLMDAENRSQRLRDISNVENWIRAMISG